jgi:hypothetical protein
MANYRKVHTKFWTDHKVESLSKEGKLLLLYLMTNPHRPSSGLYQITKERMARDCTMTVEEVEKALMELAARELVLYDNENSTVLIINAVKYLATKSKEMRKSVVNCLVYNRTPLADEFLKRHPHIRTWEEWTEDAQCTVDSRNVKEKREDDGIKF